MAGAFLSTGRMAAYGSASTLAATAVVIGALRSRSNFYSAAVMLGRSNGGMLVLLNFGVFLSLTFGRVMQKIFFGPLRQVELEHLHERMWYAITESLLAMTIFRSEFDSSFVILFGTLLLLKAFHWLTADRVDYMEQTPSLNAAFHVRMVSIQSVLLFLDLLLVTFTVEMLLLDTPRMGMMIMFASEFSILLTTMSSITAKYIINCIDLRSEEPWERKSMYVFFVDMFSDFFKLVIYIIFFAMILTFYGLPLNIVRDVYMTGRSFFGKIRDLIRYRAATKNMDDRYPTATAADMEAMSDGTCIICREEMAVVGDSEAPSSNHSNGLNQTPKKLPCGHIFHFHCLRAWLERQQSCPTCRRTVFQEGQGATQQQGPGAAAAQPPQPRQQPQPQAPPAPTVAQTARPQPSAGAPTPTTASTGTPAATTSRESGAAGSSRTTHASTSTSASRSANRLQEFLRSQGLDLGRHDSGLEREFPDIISSSTDPRQSRENPAQTTLQDPNAFRNVFARPDRVPTINGGELSWLDSSSAAQASVSEPIAESSSRPEEGIEAKNEVETLDPRTAARMAALRRFGQSSSQEATAEKKDAPRVTITPLETPPRASQSLQKLLDKVADEQHDLTELELRNISGLTRDGIEERLRILHRIDRQIWNSVQELTRCLSVLPEESGENVVGGSDAKGKQPIEGVNSL